MSGGAGAGAPRGRASSPSALRGTRAATGRSPSPGRVVWPGDNTKLAVSANGPYKRGEPSDIFKGFRKLDEYNELMKNKPPEMSDIEFNAQPHIQELFVIMGKAKKAQREMAADGYETTLVEQKDGNWKLEMCREACIGAGLFLTVGAAILYMKWSEWYPPAMGGGRRSRSRKNRKTRRRR